MAYASACDVAGKCQNILSGRDNFTTSTCPSITEVNSWLSSGCSVIETHLTSKRYSVPVAATAAIYDWIKDLNALYAAAIAELSRTNVTLAPGERTRGQVYWDMFWNQLKVFGVTDLSGAGVSVSSQSPIYVGGVSIATKDTYDSDTDRVPPRFRRGQFDFPETDRPSDVSAS